MPIVFPFTKPTLQFQFIYNHNHQRMAKKKSTESTRTPQIPVKKTRAMIMKASQKPRQRKKKKEQLSQSNEASDNNLDENNNCQDSAEQQSEQDYQSDISNSDSDQSSNITPMKPENYAVRQMTFRSKRGTQMKKLMERNKLQQQDSFWAQHRNIFGDLNVSDDEDQQDYVESSSGKDQFDSDFGQTESQYDQQPQQDEKKLVDEMDEQKEKQKKRRVQLMKKINLSRQKQQKSKIQNKDTKNEPKPKKIKSEPKIQEIGNRYIHQIFTQQQLLGQAAHTQYYNWLSLKKLISLETEKKDFTKKIKHIDGDKIVYRDRLVQNGTREVSYQLCGINANQISDLTFYWQIK